MENLKNAMENSTERIDSIDAPTLRHSNIGFTTSTPISLKPILRRHSVHNLASVKNVSFHLERNDVFTISPNKKIDSTQSDDEHVVSSTKSKTKIGSNRTDTPYHHSHHRANRVIACNVDLHLAETQTKNENTVVPSEKSESSAGTEDNTDPNHDLLTSPADDDGVLDSLSTKIEGKNENMEQSQSSTESENDLVPSPADDGGDSDFRTATNNGVHEKAVVPSKQSVSSAETENDTKPDNDLLTSPAEDDGVLNALSTKIEGENENTSVPLEQSESSDSDADATGVHATGVHASQFI